MSQFVKQILKSKAKLVEGTPCRKGDPVGEGGCGVVGFAATVPVCGRNIFEASVQMHNRGNGKGGGIAAAGLVPEQMGVSAEILKNDYLLQIALLDPEAEKEVEKAFISPNLRIDHKERIAHIDNYKDAGLEVEPPEIIRYFVRVKEDVLEAFAKENDLQAAPSRVVEDEFIYQNSFKLNQAFYASMGEQKAFVMSHARDLLIFKVVGYAEELVTYYSLENMQAHIWIAHQRFPTKGRVWHPGGAHPFIGMNEALVHNGDFANYFSIAEYLKQHNVEPQFLTDTEVSVLLFDLLTRTYGYPLEYVIEALAPTTELDFDSLPEEKKKIYRAVQAMHMHGSPDGPWFFIIARSNPDEALYQLLGITDTAMLRPQVFALQEGDVSIGLIGSEKQAIDATLQQLSIDDPRFRPIADKYWNARGGSHTDGGSFSFNINKKKAELSCVDKFGKLILPPGGEWNLDMKSAPEKPEAADAIMSKIKDLSDFSELYHEIIKKIPSWNFNNVRWLLNEIKQTAAKDLKSFDYALSILNILNNRRYDCGKMKRSVILQLVRSAVDEILDSVPTLKNGNENPLRRIDWDSRKDIRAPEKNESVLIIHAGKFSPEGRECDSRLMVEAFKMGWKRFIVYGLKGQRFTGCGFGPETENVRIDVYGSSGDYLASGIDGMEIHIHDSAQDQLCQVMKRGKLVVYGDVGQAFMYGAKGGDAYIMGNAAGRPLINAVGRPRVVINGTCLDFLAESFMAGDPLNGGGFVVLNGMQFDDKGKVVELESPYPGTNIFSLASGGAIYLRDPHRKLVDDQLNGGEFAELADEDWELILPYLKTNEDYFGVSVENDLLTVNGVRKSPKEIFRKVQPILH
jgi:glutamate synthase domain-containing protein 1/glutamate synthase domain-containing protein 3